MANRIVSLPLRDVLGCNQGFASIGQSGIKATTSLLVALCRRACQAEAVLYDEQRKALIEEFGQKTPNGEFGVVVDPKVKGYSEAKIQAFKDELESLLNTVVSITAPVLAVANLTNRVGDPVDVPPEALLACAKFFTDFDAEVVDAAASPAPDKVVSLVE